MTERTKKVLLVAVAIVVPMGAVAAGLAWYVRRNYIGAATRQIAKFEGEFHHLYLDTKGLVTTGIGNLVKTLGAAARLPWRIGGRLASSAEVARDFAAVASSAPARAARAYERLTEIRLPKSEPLRLMRERVVREFVPALRSRFPNWDAIPAPAKVALIDMIYSLGPGGFDKFRTMIHAVQRGDYRAAALASQRSGAREARNDFVRDKFYAAA